jgi:hypothetical protein
LLSRLAGEAARVAPHSERIASQDGVCVDPIARQKLAAPLCFKTKRARGTRYSDRTANAFTADGTRPSAWPRIGPCNPKPCATSELCCVQSKIQQGVTFMRLHILSVSVAAVALLAPMAATASPLVLGSIKYPDLIVSDLQAVQTAPGITQAFIDHVSFTVKEACGVKATKAFHVALKVAATPNGPSLFATTVAANPLPANGSQSWSIPLTGKAVPLNSFVRVDADSNNEVVEDVETNNYQQLNPNMAPFPQNSATYCKPHKISPITPQP